MVTRNDGGHDRRKKFTDNVIECVYAMHFVVLLYYFVVIEIERERDMFVDTLLRLRKDKPKK